MTEPKFQDILDNAEELAWKEQSHEVALAIANYPARSTELAIKRRNFLIDRAFYHLCPSKVKECR